MSENRLMKGKPVADYLTENIKAEAGELSSAGVNPRLAMIRVGENPSDLSYERGAVKRCEKCGIETEVFALEEDCTEEEYISLLKKLNEDRNVHGILCFRPLPDHLNEDRIKNIIDSGKDVDCFSPVNMAKMLSGDDGGFVPCTAMAVMEILDFYGVDPEGKNVAVIGRSAVVGKPLSMLMTNRNATVTLCHSKTSGMDRITSGCDIVVACMGRARYIDSAYIGDGAVVVDVGINFDSDGKMCGDTDFESIEKKVSKITPVPGGVGAVTTSVLAKNVIKACRQQSAVKKGY